MDGLPGPCIFLYTELSSPQFGYSSKNRKIKLDTISILINDKLARSLPKSLNPVNVLFKDIHRVYLHKTKLHYFLPYRFLK